MLTILRKIISKIDKLVKLESAKYYKKYVLLARTTRRLISPPELYYFNRNVKLKYEHFNNPEYRKLTFFTSGVTLDESLLTDTDLDVNISNVSFANFAPPNYEFYKTGRMLAESSVNELKLANSLIFSTIIAGIDLENTYKFRLIYEYGINNSPKMLAVLNRYNSKKHNLTIYDSKLSGKLISTYFNNIYTKKLNTSLTLKTTITESHFISWFKNIRNESSLFDSANYPELKDSNIFFIGSVLDLTTLKPAIDIVERHTPIIFILKNDNDYLKSLIIDLSKSNDNYYYFENKYLMSTTSKYHDLDEIEKSIMNLISNRNSSKISGGDSLLRTHVLDLLNVIRIYINLTTIIELFSPQAFFGLFEKNINGPLLTVLKTRHDFKVYNFQHAFIPYAHTLDLMSFDDFFVWNKGTKSLLESDGYAGIISTLGNPIWEAMSGYTSAQHNSHFHNTFDVWRGDSQIIGFFSQPLRWPIAGVDYWEVLINHFFNYPGLKYNKKILIRKHPAEIIENPTAKELELVKNGKLLISEAKDMPLNDTIAYCDTVVSVCSTVLIDALSMSKPVISYDCFDVYKKIKIDIPPEIPIAHNYKQLYKLLDESFLLREKINLNPNWLPIFNDLYKERLQKRLTDTGNGRF